MEVEGGREENNGWSGRKGTGEESWEKLRTMEEVEGGREDNNGWRGRKGRREESWRKVKEDGGKGENNAENVMFSKSTDTKQIVPQL
jgi:hypothetical protein